MEQQRETDQPQGRDHPADPVPALRHRDANRQRHHLSHDEERARPELRSEQCSGGGDEERGGTEHEDQDPEREAGSHQHRLPERQHVENEEDSEAASAGGFHDGESGRRPYGPRRTRSGRLVARGVLTLRCGHRPSVRAAW